MNQLKLYFYCILLLSIWCCSDAGNPLVPIMGCTDSSACNENSDATDDDGSCYYANNVNATTDGQDLLYKNCDGTCISDIDGDGVCDGVISGCTDEAACNYDELATEDDGSCITPINDICVSYSNDIQPIFNSNCNGCHIGGTSGNLDLSDGSSYNNLVNVVSNFYAPALRVLPEDTANSVLWNKVAGTGVNGGQMPQGGQLTQDEIDLIENWINEGANLDPPTIFNLILKDVR